MASESQTLPHQPRRLPKPWSFLLFKHSPLRPTTTGILLGIGLLGLLVLIESLSGRPQQILNGASPISVGCEYLLGDYRIGVVGIILLAYTTTARFVLTLWTRSTAVELSAGRSSFEDAETIASQRRWGILPGLAGAMLCIIFAVDIAQRDVEWTRAYWIAPHLFNWLWCIPFGWTGGRLIYSLITNAVLISRVAKHTKIQNIEDQAPLDAVIKQGSRSALLSLMFLGLVSVHFIDPGLGFGTIIFLIILFVIGASISTLPVLGVVQVLYEIKDKQLAHLRQELNAEESNFLKSSCDYTPGRLSDIVALEKRLDDWRVTIFHFSNIARVGLYSLVGFFSWLGAAAVSIVVENMFGF